MARFCWTWRLSSSVRHWRAALPLSARRAAGNVCRREGDTLPTPHLPSHINSDLETLFQDFEAWNVCTNADKKGVSNLILLSVHCWPSHCEAMRRLQLLWLDLEAKNLQAHGGFGRSKPCILTRAQPATLPLYKACMKPVGWIKNYKQTFHLTHNGSIRGRMLTFASLYESGHKQRKKKIHCVNISPQCKSLTPEKQTWIIDVGTRSRGVQLQSGSISVVSVCQWGLAGIMKVNRTTSGRSRWVGSLEDGRSALPFPSPGSCCRRWRRYRCGPPPAGGRCWRRSRSSPWWTLRRSTAKEQRKSFSFPKLDVFCNLKFADNIVVLVHGKMFITLSYTGQVITAVLLVFGWTSFCFQQCPQF